MFHEWGVTKYLASSLRRTDAIYAYCMNKDKVPVCGENLGPSRICHVKANPCFSARLKNAVNKFVSK
jgi:hypothetical protein